MTTTRQITTYYTAADGTEPDITVEVSEINRREVEVSGLDDVPAEEERGVIERATELYWEAERRQHNAEQICDERDNEPYDPRNYCE